MTSYSVRLDSRDYDEKFTDAADRVQTGKRKNRYRKKTDRTNEAAQVLQKEEEIKKGEVSLRVERVLSITQCVASKMKTEQSDEESQVEEDVQKGVEDSDSDDRVTKAEKSDSEAPVEDDEAESEVRLDEVAVSDGENQLIRERLGAEQSSVKERSNSKDSPKAEKQQVKRRTSVENQKNEKTNDSGKKAETPSQAQLMHFLSQNIHDLSPDIQKKFQLFLEDKQRVVAGFQSVVESHNTNYDTEPQKKKAEVREEYSALREKDKKELQDLFNDFGKCEKVFADRIKALQKAISTYEFESTFWNECINGNDSWFSSLRSFKLAIDDRYGAKFKFWQIDEALKIFKPAAAQEAPVSSDAPPTQSSGKVEESRIIIVQAKGEDSPSLHSRLKQILFDLVKLKAEVLICNASLKKKAVDLAENRDLPQNYYFAHKNQFEQIKARINALEKDAVANRLKEIEEAMRIESCTPNSPQFKAFQQERIQLPKLDQEISGKLKQITNLLNERKALFNLSDEEPKEAIPSLRMGQTSNKALDLAFQVTCLSEEILLQNSWVETIPMEQRQVYYQDFHLLSEALKLSKAIFEAGDLRTQLEVIDTAVSTYRSYIAILARGDNKIKAHFDFIQKLSLQRAGWDVEKLPPVLPPSTAQTKSQAATTTTTSTTTSTPAASTATTSTTTSTTTTTATTTPTTTTNTSTTTAAPTIATTTTTPATSMATATTSSTTTTAQTTASKK